jgi:hypothetical protein
MAVFSVSTKEPLFGGEYWMEFPIFLYLKQGESSSKFLEKIEKPLKFNVFNFPINPKKENKKYLPYFL